LVELLEHLLLGDRAAFHAFAAVKRLVRAIVGVHLIAADAGALFAAVNHR
jgi:hypothetical protein